MKAKILLALKSRTFWTAAVVLAYNILTVFTKTFPTVAGLTDTVNILGLLLTGYFHVNPSQNYTAPTA